MEREEGRKTREEKRKEEKEEGTERGILRSSNQRERSEEN